MKYAQVHIRKLNINVVEIINSSKAFCKTFFLFSTGILFKYYIGYDLHNCLS